MKWAKSDKNRLITHQNAYRIYQDILLSLEAYSHDSFETKFFLPEEISEHCKPVAASFTHILSAPSLSSEEIYNSRLYYLYYLSLIYGAQIFLKEYSLLNNHKAYSIEKDTEKIEAIKNIVTTLLGEEFTLTTEATLVMDLYKEQLSHTKKKIYLQIAGKTVKEEDFDRCLHGTLIWGYFFAKEMIRP